MYTYLWIFFIFAFVGWCGEVVFAAVVDRRFVNRGFLNGPLCPIYGFGVVLIDFCLRPVGNSIPALLIGSMVLGSALEWLAGFLLEKLFHQKWWDYSNEPHNLNGYICLRFSVVWAIAGTVVVRGVMPLTRQMIAWIPRTLGWVLLGVLLVLALADFTVTAVAIIGINRKLKNLEAVTQTLKAGSDQLGEALYAGTMAAEEKRKELEEETARLRKKTEESLKASRLYRRLLKAFPDLRSLRHNEQLEALRENVSVIRRRSSEALKRRDELARAAYEQTLAAGEEKPFAYGLCFDKLFWIFMVGSFVGFVCETLYALAVPPHVLEPRVSFVFGPFIAVYGLGAMAITMFLYRMYNQRDILIFLASMVLGAAFEYLCSFLQQAAFGTVSWEYSDSLLNIGGRTNLMYAVFWGILGLVWIKDLYPVLSRRIQRIPRKVGKPLTAVTGVLLAIDVFLTVGALYRQSQRVNHIPAGNPAQVFFDTAFPDEYLDFLFPHMQYLGKPEIVKEPPLPANQD